MTPLRAAAKHLFEAAVVGTGLVHRRIRTRRNDVAILSYHNIVPQGERPIGDRSLHLPQERFGEHLDQLLETHRVVDLDQVFVDGSAPSEDGRPLAVLTFDDGYLGALTAGVEELHSRGLPATVFVNPGALEWEGFWWDHLADPETGLLPPGARDHALGPLEGRQDRILAWAAQEGLARATLPDYARPAPEAWLLKMEAEGRVRLGSHSWSHPSLPALDPEELGRELGDALDWLSSRCAAPSAWLAWPYGHSSEEAEASALGLHPAGLILSGRLARTIDRRARPMGLPRINVPRGLSTRGLTISLADLF